MNREKLIAAGIDYDEGLHRFANKEALYEKYLKKFIADTTFSELKGQIDAKDYAGVFRIAHDLKGLSSNLSINAFYNAICVLVEECRNGNPSQDLELVYQDALDKYEVAIAALKEETE